MFITSSNTSIQDLTQPENKVLSKGTDDWNIISNLGGAKGGFNIALKNRLMMQNFLIKYGSYPIGLTVFCGFYSGGGEFKNKEISSCLGGDVNVSWVKKTASGKMKVNVYVQDPEKDYVVRGGHALTCVGWDYSKEVHDRTITMLQKWFGKSSEEINSLVTSLQKLLNHPYPYGFYWIVRNSWGKKLGN